MEEIGKLEGNDKVVFHLMYNVRFLKGKTEQTLKRCVVGSQCAIHSQKHCKRHVLFTRGVNVRNKINIF